MTKSPNTQKLTERSGDPPAPAHATFIQRLRSRYEEIAAELRDRGEAWSAQAQLADDVTEKDQYAAIAAAHDSLLGKPGTTPVSFNTIAEMLEEVRPSFRIRRPPSPAPRNAWIVIGNDDSWIDRKLLDNINAEPDHWYWNGSPYTEENDLLFFYYTAPRGAVCFVARTDRDPYYESNVETRADISPGQWWFSLKSLVEIEPIPFKELCAICGEQLILRGQSGKRLTAAMANALLSRIKIKHPTDSDILVDIMRPVVNRSLPEPGTMTLDDLQNLASGSLNLEKDVEEYIVDPLLRLAGVNSEPYRTERQVRVGKGLADRVVFEGDKVMCVVEVKRRLHLDRDRNWERCVDVEQARGYAEKFASRFLLIDVDSIALFNAGQRSPVAEFDRRYLDEASLREIAAFVSGRDGR